MNQPHCCIGAVLCFWLAVTTWAWLPPELGAEELPDDDASEVAYVALLVRGSPKDPRLDELLTRLRAELLGADFLLLGDAPAASPFASIEVLEDDARHLAVDVTLDEAVTGRAVTNRLVLDTDDAQNTTPSVVAVLVTEFLRAHHIAHQLGTRSDAKLEGAQVQILTETIERPLAPPPGLTESQPTRTSITLAGSGMLSGVGPNAGATLRISRELPRNLLARASLLGPTLGAEVTQPNGGADVREWAALAEVGASFRPHTRRVTMGPTLGAGVYVANIQGRAAPPFVTERVTAWSVAFDLGFFVHVSLLQWLSLNVEAHGLTAARPIRILIDGTPSALAGRALGYATLGLEVQW